MMKGITEEFTFEKEIEDIVKNRLDKGMSKDQFIRVINNLVDKYNKGEIT